MQMLQKIVQTGRKIIPRGWSPFLRFVSGFYPHARMYPIILNNEDTLFLDLSQNMCHGYFYFNGLRHEKFTTAFFEKNIQLGDNFVDVGANIGYFTKLASRLVGEEGTVYALEPMPEAIRVLKENIKNSPNVKLREIAVSNNTGTEIFSVNSKGDTSSLGIDSSAIKQIQVKLDTLDNLLQNESKIDAIKIDVEGYEYEVLQGATRTIEEHKPLLYFEYIDVYMSKRSLKFDDYKLLLEPFGYTLKWINPNYPNGSLFTDEQSHYIIGIPKKDRWKSLN